MNKQEILEFLNQNLVAALGTSEEGRPSVRMVWTVKADEHGILFHSSKASSLSKHFSKNPAGEFCFLNPDRSIQIRVSGVVRVLEDPQLKSWLAEQRPFLKALEKAHGSLDFFQVYRLENAQADVWTMATNGKPRTRISLNT